MTQWVGQSTLLTFNSAPWGFCVTNSLWSSPGSHSVLGRSVSRERPHVGTDWESVLTTAACYSPPASGSLDDAQGRCQEPWGLSSLTSAPFFFFLFPAGLRISEATLAAAWLRSDLWSGFRSARLWSKLYICRMVTLQWPGVGESVLFESALLQAPLLTSPWFTPAGSQQQHQAVR